jgi:DNA-binding CsgD family transcriptional regulator
MVDETRRQLLSALGVDADNEHVYRLLLASPGASVNELRESSGYGVQRLRKVLRTLEQTAMVTRRSGTPVRYHAAPPALVVEALISAREGELKQARLDARQLTSVLTQAPKGRLDVTEVVEILTSPEAVNERYLQLQLAARSKVEVFARLPLAQTATDEHEPIQASLSSRGVVMRAIYDAEVLHHPGILAHIRRVTALGEQSRTVSRLPLKLALFDRTSGLVLLTQLGREETVSSGLLVHQSALLDALTDLFEIYWKRATPLNLAEQTTNRRPPVADEQAVLTLLAAGLKDESIARQLTVSTYTVRRRIAAVIERFGVINRFQAGLLLGQRGWPDVKQPELEPTTASLAAPDPSIPT